MGVYVYRVTARTIKLTDGRTAHVAEYAYKISSDHRYNARAHFKTGCYSSERLNLKTDLIVTFWNDHEHEGSLWHNPDGLKVFSDDYNMGTERMPKLGEVKRVGLTNKYSFALVAAA